MKGSRRNDKSVSHSFHLDCVSSTALLLFFSKRFPTFNFVPPCQTFSGFLKLSAQFEKASFVFVPIIFWKGEITFLSNKKVEKKMSLSGFLSSSLLRRSLGPLLPF